MDWLVANWETIGIAVASVVAAAAAIATITPTKTDDKIVNVLLRVVNVLGLNVGKAKNKDDV